MPVVPTWEAGFYVESRGTHLIYLSQPSKKHASTTKQNMTTCFAFVVRWNLVCSIYKSETSVGLLLITETNFILLRISEIALWWNFRILTIKLLVLKLFHKCKNSRNYKNVVIYKCDKDENTPAYLYDFTEYGWLRWHTRCIFDNWAFKTHVQIIRRGNRCGN